MFYPRPQYSRLLLPFLCLSVTGCNLIGAASKLMPPETIQPKYVGLAGQRVAVMVWVDRGLAIDYPGLNTDTCAAIQNALQSSQANELKGAVFPYKAASMTRYQQDHPEIVGSDMAEVAARLDIGRLIYIEVEDFTTRAASMELFRGQMTVTMRVYEVTNGVGRMAYEENNIHAIFPPGVAEDGTPRGTDYKIYVGTVQEAALEVLHRLTPYENPNS